MKLHKGGYPGQRDSGRRLLDREGGKGIPGQGHRMCREHVPCKLGLAGKTLRCVTGRSKGCFVLGSLIPISSI